MNAEVAYIEISGTQLKVTAGARITVNRMQGEPGDAIEINKVVARLSADGEIEVGAAKLKNASVSGKILKHSRGEKLVAFKRKRRKGYKRKVGHRQDLTVLEITKIN